MLDMGFAFSELTSLKKSAKAIPKKPNRPADAKNGT